MAPGGARIKLVPHPAHRPTDRLVEADETLRRQIMPNSTLKGRANLFVLPNLDSANIAYNMVRVVTEGVAIGPILMGLDKPAYVLTPAATSRRIINMSAIAAVEAQIRAAFTGDASVFLVEPRRAGETSSRSK